MSKNGKTFREKELLLEVARSIVKRYGFFSFLERFQFSRQKNPTVIRHSDTNYFKLHFLVNDIRHAFHKLH